MLVALFNAVKVESVPLKFGFFGRTLAPVVNAGTSNSVRQG